MAKKEIADLIRAEGLIPVVRVATAQVAREVAEALREGGARLVEITFTVAGAVEVIREISRKYDGQIVPGAGTVLDMESARQALDAGARFLVSPVLSTDILEFALKNDLVSIPGAMTPTEILDAWNGGADMVKVFPAARLGGPEYIRSLRGPFPGIPMVPTGGIDLGSVPAYIRAGAVAVGVGGELVDKKALSEKRYDLITSSTRAFLDAIREARGG